MSVSESQRSTKFRNNCKLRKKIFNHDDLEHFKSSKTCEVILNFIDNLSESVLGKTLRDEVKFTDLAKSLCGILDRFEVIIDEHPPLNREESRFGNKAFRNWHKQILIESKALLAAIVPEDNVREIRGYLLHSFGHPGRIDYGTGHELNFITLLLCLTKLNLFTQDDYPALVLKVFWRYVMLMRKLFTEYWLEPAGSQGVWGLDDYCFLPFLFGAAQLSTHKYLRPKSILNEDYLEEFEHDYMYFSSIKFINSVKTAPFVISSPLLNDISGIKQWSKVRSGLLKMYKEQVLWKITVIQHYFFGSILKLREDEDDLKSVDSSSGEDELYGCDDTNSHAHNELEGFPDCCGIRIPSSIAASRSQERDTYSQSKNKAFFIPND